MWSKRCTTSTGCSLLRRLLGKRAHAAVTGVFLRRWHRIRSDDIHQSTLPDDGCRTHANAACIANSVTAADRQWRADRKCGSRKFGANLRFTYKYLAVADESGKRATNQNGRSVWWTCNRTKLTTLATVEVFELQRVICRKSPILTYPTCIWRLRCGWPRLSFADIIIFI